MILNKLYKGLSYKKSATRSNKSAVYENIKIYISPSIKWCLILFNIQRKLLETKKWNFFIIYELDTQTRVSNSDFTLKDCLFRCAELVKNADSDKYEYTGYGFGFDSRSEFLFTDESMRKNVISFGLM